MNAETVPEQIARVEAQQYEQAGDWPAAAERWAEAERHARTPGAIRRHAERAAECDSRGRARMETAAAVEMLTEELRERHGGMVAVVEVCRVLRRPEARTHADRAAVTIAVAITHLTALRAAL